MRSVPNLTAVVRGSCLGLLWLVASALPAQRANLLVIVADDLGVDSVGAYAEGRDLPPTPTLDQLARRGVLFRNAWATALCSPTRAAIQTGRHGSRTGVGAPVTYPVSPCGMSFLPGPPQAVLSW